MVARVGTLAVGTQFDTLLTGRRGVVRAAMIQLVPEAVAVVIDGQARAIHRDVRVRVVEVTH